MITCEMVENARKEIITSWGEQGTKIAELCSNVTPFNGNSKEFLEHCLECGGNWGGMLLTGIHKLYPDVWNAIPNDMGEHAWNCICSTLILCGVDTSE